MPFEANTQCENDGLLPVRVTFQKVLPGIAILNATLANISIKMAQIKASFVNVQQNLQCQPGSANTLVDRRDYRLAFPDHESLLNFYS